MNLSALCPRPDFLRPFDDWSRFEGIRFGLTGHRGTLGALLASRLRQAGATISTFDGDVTDEPRLTLWVSNAKPHIVFNLAAVVPVEKVNEDPAQAMRVNSVAPFFLAEALRRSTTDAWLFHASTSHVYSASIANIGINPPRLSESACCIPASLYGATKLAGERILAPLADALGSRVCIGRIFSFFHETQPASFLIPGLVKRISCVNPHDAIEVNNPEAIRDFLYADHVVDALLHLAAHRCTGVVNIASGHGMSVRSIAKRLVCLSTKPVQIRDVQRGNVTSLVADVSKLEKLLNQGFSQ